MNPTILRTVPSSQEMLRPTMSAVKIGAESEATMKSAEAWAGSETMKKDRPVNVSGALSVRMTWVLSVNVAINELHPFTYRSRLPTIGAEKIGAEAVTFGLPEVCVPEIDPENCEPSWEVTVRSMKRCGK